MMMTNKSDLPRGLRNNNPGNIRKGGAVRYVGEVTPSADSEFRQFEKISYGYRAMFVVLYTYNKRYKINTIEGLIRRYAPASENNTEAYIKRVSAKSGIKRDMILDLKNGTMMIPIVSAMSEVENGLAAIMEDVTAGWELFILS